MSRHLKNMRIGKVSLVDRGANGERIAVLKAAPPSNDDGDAVEKAGRKISTARAARLREARDALDAVLAEADEPERQVAKADTPTEVDMDPEALAQALTPLLAPIIDAQVGEAVTKRLDELGITKHAKPADDKADSKADDKDDEPSVKDVVRAVSALADRMERLEDVHKRSDRQSQPVAGEPVTKATTKESLAAAIL